MALKEPHKDATACYELILEALEQILEALSLCGEVGVELETFSVFCEKLHKKLSLPLPVTVFAFVDTQPRASFFCLIRTCRGLLKYNWGLF